MVEENETNLRVFNTAKKFSEEILFPLMEQYQAYQCQSDFGTAKLQDSIILDEEIRDIERYNGLKAMADVCLNLALAIKSTVNLKNNKEEMKQLEITLTCLESIKNLFYEKKDLFFTTGYRGTRQVEIIKRNYFEQIKKIIQVCYVNTEILMTRNKLLFADSSDDYKNDEELMEAIKKEYIEG
jgi:hypothetical protein